MQALTYVCPIVTETVNELSRNRWLFPKLINKNAFRTLIAFIPFNHRLVIYAAFYEKTRS